LPNLKLLSQSPTMAIKEDKSPFEEKGGPKLQDGKKGPA
jgi:hypothetical protein